MKSMFSNFTYQKAPLTKKSMHEVIVTYRYKGKIIYYYYFSKNKNTCLEGAKEKIKELIKNDELRRYSNHFIEYVYNNNRKRKSLIAGCVVALAGIATAGSLLALKYMNAKPAEKKVDFVFDGGDSCVFQKESGEPIIGKQFTGVIDIKEGVTGHLPATLDIKMDGKPVPLSKYEFNPYTGEFSIIPTGKIEISVREETCTLSFVYRCTEEDKKILFETNDEDFTINWGDDSDPEEHEYRCIHEYTKPGEYNVKVNDCIDIIQLVSFKEEMAGGLVSISFFQGFTGSLAGWIFGQKNPTLLPNLEKICIGSQVGLTKLAYSHPKLHTIVCDDANEKIKDFDSNIIAYDESSSEETESNYSVELGCDRSIIPEGKNITSISDHAFYGSGIKEINLPSSYNFSYYNPFRSCQNLEKITVTPSSPYVTSRDKSGRECNAIITKVPMKAGVAMASNMLLATCKNTIIPDDGTVAGISEVAYWDNPIVNIDIPDCVEYLDFCSIYGCENLEYINFSKSSNLTDIVKSNVRYVYPKGSFNGCSSLKSFTIPSSVINENLPEAISLFDITNTSLTEVIVLPDTPPSLPGRLYKTGRQESKPPILESVYVPDASVETYKNHSDWMSCADLIKPLSERPTH